MQNNPPNNRQSKTNHIIKYIDTDLLCYRTESPKELAKLQHKAWQPWIDWFEENYGDKLETTTGISALTQSNQIKHRLQAEIDTLNEQELEALYGAVTISGSCVLGLALIKDKLTAEEISDIIFLEENYKDGIYDAEKYGTDPHIDKKKKEALNNLNHAAALVRESTKNASASNA